MRYLALTTFIFLTCSTHAQFLNGKPPQQPTNNSVNIKILSDEHKGSIKRTVEVELEERTDTATLAMIAKRIKATEQREYERTFIGYRLKEGDGNSYWATTHFNPELEVKILGTTQRDHELLKKKTTTQENVIGTWMAQRSTSYKIVAYRKNGTVFIKNIYPGSDYLDEDEYASTQLSNGLKLQSESDKFRGEFYLINPKGDLEFWSKNGNYYTAKKI